MLGFLKYCLLEEVEEVEMVEMVEEVEMVECFSHSTFFPCPFRFVPCSLNSGRGEGQQP